GHGRLFSQSTHKPLAWHEVFQCRGTKTEGQMGPPTNLGGYWTNDSAIGTFDHHDAGWVDVRPGQGDASRWGASEHGTAESRGGRGRGRNRGLSLCAARGAQGLP